MSKTVFSVIFHNGYPNLYRKKCGSVVYLVKSGQTVNQILLYPPPSNELLQPLGAPYDLCHRPQAKQVQKAILLVPAIRCTYALFLQYFPVTPLSFGLNAGVSSKGCRAELKAGWLAVMRLEALK